MLFYHLSGALTLESSDMIGLLTRLPRYATLVSLIHDLNLDGDCQTSLSAKDAYFKPMALTKEQKDKIIKKYRTHENDTGSSEVQIAILTAEIDQLSDHLKKHKHDFSSRVGLIRKVQERKRLLKYLYRENAKSYTDLVKALKIKSKIVEEQTEDDQEDKK